MRDPSSSSSSSHKTLGGYRFDNNVAGCVQRRSRAVICIGIISHLHSEKVVLVLVVVNPSTSPSLLAGNSKAVCGLSLTASPKEFEHGASLSRQLDHKVSVMRRRFSLTMSTGLFVSCHSGFATGLLPLGRVVMVTGSRPDCMVLKFGRTNPMIFGRGDMICAAKFIHSNVSILLHRTQGQCCQIYHVNN